MAANATDAAAKLAAEHGIDLVGVTGTGADGRITKGDVEAHLAAAAEAAKGTAVSEEFDTEAAVESPPEGPETAVVAAEPASEPATVVSEELCTDTVETAVATGSESETAVTLTFGEESLRVQTAEAKTEFSALTALVDEPETAVADPPLFAWRVENAATLQELIALGDQATDEAERAAIRARAKELLTA